MGKTSRDSGSPESDWTWLRPTNIDRQGNPRSVYCALCKDDIEEGAPRVMHKFARYILCEDCGTKEGAPPVDARGRGQTAGKPGRPSTRKAAQPMAQNQTSPNQQELLQQLVSLLQQQQSAGQTPAAVTQPDETDEDEDAYYEQAQKNAPDKSEAKPVATSKGSISEERLANWFAETAWPRIESFVHDEIERAVGEIVEQQMDGVRKQLAPLFGYEVKGPADTTRLRVAFDAGWKYNNLQQQFNDLSKEVHEKLNEFAAKAKAAKSAEDMTPPSGKMQRVIEVQTP